MPTYDGWQSWLMIFSRVSLYVDPAEICSTRKLFRCHEIWNGTWTEREREKERKREREKKRESTEGPSIPNFITAKAFTAPKRDFSLSLHTEVPSPFLPPQNRKKETKREGDLACFHILGLDTHRHGVHTLNSANSNPAELTKRVICHSETKRTNSRWSLPIHYAIPAHLRKSFRAQRASERANGECEGSPSKIAIIINWDIISSWESQANYHEGKWRIMPLLLFLLLTLRKCLTRAKLVFFLATNWEIGSVHIPAVIRQIRRLTEKLAEIE